MRNHWQSCWWAFMSSLNSIDVRVYAACTMTGRDKHEQVARAKLLREIFAVYGITLISPVLEEHIPDEPGILKETDAVRLKRNWARDKEIIAYETHVTLMDGGDEGSVGMGREYGFNRYGLWKPTITLWNRDRGLTVAQFEDDQIFVDPFAAAFYIASTYGTRWQRVKWRLGMLARSLPRFIKRQIYAFQ